MSATVEVTHSNILQRVNIIKQCIQVIKADDMCGNTCDIVAIVQNEYNALRRDYDEQSGTMLLKYYENAENSPMYFAFIGFENIATRLDQCMHYVDECCEIVKNTWNICGKIDKLKRMYNQSPVFEQPTQTIDYTMCLCGLKMNTTPNGNAVVCYGCGQIKFIHNDSIEDTIYGRHDDKGVKHCKYDPSRRCKFWIDRIQGKEVAEISQECLDAVKACICRDNLSNSSIILCLQIREYLKETGFTGYNDHVTLIRKLITGYTPPCLTEKELKILYHIFNKVITVFDDIKPAKKYNSPYYPYLVGKILYDLIPPGMRRRQILECIHMQSNTTLISNDKLMKSICKRVSEIKYVPTIKSEFTIIM